LGDSDEPGARIIQNGCTSEEDQLFRFAEDRLNPGRYYIIVDRTGMCLGPQTNDPMAPIVQARCTTQEHHKFRVEPGSGRYRRIVSEASGLCLAVQGSSPEEGARIVHFGCSGRPNQQFEFVR
jgi:hypothetical protein